MWSEKSTTSLFCSTSKSKAFTRHYVKEKKFLFLFFIEEETKLKVWHFNFGECQSSHHSWLCWIEVLLMISLHFTFWVFLNFGKQVVGIFENQQLFHGFVVGLCVLEFHGFWMIFGVFVCFGCNWLVNCKKGLNLIWVMEYFLKGD